MKKLLVILIILLSLVVSSIATLAQGQTKSPVCHLDEEANYVLISVADPALDAHYDHGDPVIGIDVDETCQPNVPLCLELTPVEKVNLKLDPFTGALTGSIFLGFEGFADVPLAGSITPADFLDNQNTASFNLTGSITGPNCTRSVEFAGERSEGSTLFTALSEVSNICSQSGSGAVGEFPEATITPGVCQ